MAVLRTRTAATVGTVAGGIVAVVAAIATTVPTGARPAAATSPCVRLRTPATVVAGPDSGAAQVSLAEASYTVDEPDKIFLEQAGRITGRPDRGNVLYLVGTADPNSHDSTPKHGAGVDRYRLLGQISPDDAGCWSTQRREVGYSCAGGLRFRYYLALMPESEAAELLHLQATSPDQGIRDDGFTAAEIQRRRSIALLSRFDVPTRPTRC